MVTKIGNEYRARAHARGRAGGRAGRRAGGRAGGQDYREKTNLYAI